MTQQQVENAVVIGIGCRLPGEATSPSKLWEMMCEGKSGWGPVTRFNHQGFYHPDPQRQGAIPIKGAHFLTQHPAEFDASFFAVPAAAARSMDPQQALLLEVTYEALENAGITMEEIRGSRTSVFIASFVKDYEIVSLREIDSQPDLAATGNGTAILSNRISYFFDLKGPSITIDTACSGSLVAIDLAIQSLKARSSDMAIVGGVNMMLVPDTMIPMSSMGFLSSEGKCFAFDSRAGGYGRGEGAGIVILKRLADALTHNDTIRAEVVGHGVNQDGRTSGITMPNLASQESNIMDVYTCAGIDFNQTAFVECHGTGTIVGDKTEMAAISSSIVVHRSNKAQPIYIGSVKTNIGHLEGAAGVAGFIKAVLTVEKGQIPPNINFENPRGDIKAEDLGLQIPLKVTEWPACYHRRQVSINSFGFGGTNAHVVVADAQKLQFYNSTSFFSDDRLLRDLPFVFSAQDTKSLQRLIQNFKLYLAKKQPSSPKALRELAHTLCARRSGLSIRVAYTAKSLTNLLTQLSDPDVKNFSLSSAIAPRICFVFAGQGGVWPSMASNLMSFPNFRQSLAQASQYLQTCHSWDRSIEPIIWEPDKSSCITDIDIAQVVTTAVQISCIDLLNSLGVIASTVIGHSSGEIAAAYAAGKISKEFAWSCAFLRGIWVKRLQDSNPDVTGEMVSVSLSQQQAEELLDELAFDRSKILVACINSPKSITVSGRKTEVIRLTEELSRRNIFHRLLQVPVAYHSPDMEIIEQAYVHDISRINHLKGTFVQTKHGQLPTMVSTLYGKVYSNHLISSDYWGRNLTTKVGFEQGIRHLMKKDSTLAVFLEVGTGGCMRTPVLDCIKTQPGRTAKYISLLHSKQHTEAAAIGRLTELWTSGVNIDIDHIVKRYNPEERLSCLVDLPSYSWNHESRYWAEPPMSTAHLRRRWPRRDLIGSRTLNSNPFEMKWRGFHRVSENPWIRDHKVQGSILYPVAGMITMAIEAGVELIETEGIDEVIAFEVLDFKIHQAMVVPLDDSGLESTISMKQVPETRRRRWKFSIYSRAAASDMKLNASGTLVLATTSAELERYCVSQQGRLNAFKKLSMKNASHVELYECLEAIGLVYGPTFRNISAIKRPSIEATSSFVTVDVPNTASVMPHGFEFPHVIHPATLDSMLHALFTPMSEPMVPIAIDRITISTSLGKNKSYTAFEGCSIITDEGVRQTTGDVVMVTQGNNFPEVIMQGIRLAALQMPPGWLKSHRNLATSLSWAEDIATMNFEGRTIEQLLKAVAVKTSTLEVLVIGWTQQAAALISTLKTCGSVVKLTVQQHSFAPLDEDFLAKTSLKSTVMGSHDLPEASRLFDIIFVCAQDGVRIKSLHPSLATHGIMLLPSQVSFEKDYLKCDHGIRNFTQIGEITAYHGDRMTALGAPRLALNKAVTVLLPADYHRSLKNLVIKLHSAFAAHDFKVCATTLPLPNYIHGTFVISLLHLTREIKLWAFHENIDVLKSLVANAAGILFVSQPDIDNGMFGASMTGLVRALISEGVQIPLGTLRLSVTQMIPQSHQSIVNAAMQVFSDTTMSDVEFEERNGSLFIPRLKLVEAINAELDPSLKQDNLVPFSDNTTVLSCKRMTGSEDNFVWTSAPESLVTSKQISVKLTALPITQAQLLHLRGIKTSDFPSPSIGPDIFGVVDGCPVMGLIPPTPLRSVVPVDPRLVRQLPIDGSLKCFSLAAYVAAVAAFVGRYPIMEEMGSEEISQLANIDHTYQRVLIVGGDVAGLTAMIVSDTLGYQVYSAVETEREAKFVQELGIPKQNVFVCGTVLDTEFWASRFDLVFVAKDMHLPLIKCRIIFSTIESSITAKASVRYTWDLQQLLQEDISLLAQIIDVVQSLVISDRLLIFREVSILETYSLTEAVTSLKNASSSLVVLNFPDDMKVKAIPPSPFQPLCSVLQQDSLYVLIGSSRGLAGSIATYLVENGARHLAFLSRSAGSSDDIDFAETLRPRGISIQFLSVDITSGPKMSQAANLLKQHPGGVGGIVQCAGLLRDSMFNKMSQDDWNTVVQPKICGSQTLVASFISDITQDRHTWLIFLSSAAGIIGNRGQANYAAANTWIDTFARELRECGIKASSLAFGPVMGPGMIARDPTIMKALKASGFFGIREGDFLKVIGMAIVSMATQDGIFPVNTAYGLGTGGLLKQMKTTDPYWRDTAVYTHLTPVDLPESVVREALADNSENKITPIDLTTIDGVVTALSAALAERLEMSPNSIDAEQSMLAYGLDSFSGFWLRKWVEEHIGVNVPVFEIIGDVSISSLAKNVIKRLAATHVA